jgi:hypothetical protein
LERSAAETKMGVDIRYIPAEAVSALPDRLREAGFVVEIGSETTSQHAGVVVTLAKCRRGGDTQRLGWNPIPGRPGVFCMGIINARGWRRSVRERRERLQAEVTSIIESSGGYSPFPN